MSVEFVFSLGRFLETLSSKITLNFGATKGLSSQQREQRPVNNEPVGKKCVISQGDWEGINALYTTFVKGRRGERWSDYRGKE